MEIIDTALIERIRKALIKRYDRDQQIQQMIEEIGAEEGLNESELAIVYQAYLEVKERVYYTSSLVNLWNQIEEVQKRMSMLHTYDSLEEDLFGNVLDNQEDIIIADRSYLGKGASHNNDVYAMEQVQLSDIPAQHDSTVGMNHIKLNELHSMGGLFTGSGESSKHEMSDLDEALVEHMNVNPLDGVESLEVRHLDEDNPFDAENSVLLSKSKDTETFYTNKDASSKKDDINENDMSSIDPYTAVNALLFGKSGLDSDKANKKMEKLLKKQLKRVDDEWARINGSDVKKSKDEKKSKEDKKSKDDKKSKEDKKEKKHKKSKEGKHSKDEEKLKKKKDKAEKKLKVLNDKLKTVFLGDTFSKKDKKKKDKKSEKGTSEKKQKR